MRAILLPLTDAVDSVLIAIDPRDEELDDFNSYRLQVVTLMDPEDYADPVRRGSVEAATEKLLGILDQCEGIELDACVCQSMSDMTLDVFRDFSIWDYDELSLDVGAQPPQHIP